MSSKKDEILTSEKVLWKSVDCVEKRGCCVLFSFVWEYSYLEIRQFQEQNGIHIKCINAKMSAAFCDIGVHLVCEWRLKISSRFMSIKGSSVSLLSYRLLW